MQHDLFAPPVTKGIVPGLAAAGCKCIRRILRMQVLLTEVDVLERVRLAFHAARLADRVGGESTSGDQNGT